MERKLKWGIASVGAVGIVLAGAIGLSNGVWDYSPKGPPAPEVSVSVPAPEPSPEVPLPAPVQPPESLPEPAGPAVPGQEPQPFSEAPVAPVQIPVDPAPSPIPVLPAPVQAPQPPLNLPDISSGTEVQITLPPVPDVVNVIPPVVDQITKPLPEIPLPVLPQVIKETNELLDQTVHNDPLPVGGTGLLGDDPIRGKLDGKAGVAG